LRSHQKSDYEESRKNFLGTLGLRSELLRHHDQHHAESQLLLDLNCAETSFAGRVETGRSGFSDPRMGGVI